MNDAQKVVGIFLAAGFATRMYPLTKDQPKSLLEVGGAPLLTRLIHQVEATGLVEDVIVVHNTLFAPDFREWHLNLDSELSVRLIDDGTTHPQERLGALADLALGLSESTPSPPAGYLVAAADNCLCFSLDDPLRQYLTHGDPLLLWRNVPLPVPPSTYSDVEIDEQGLVTTFTEKPANPRGNKSAIACYLLPQNLPDLLKAYLDNSENHDAPGHFIAWLVNRQKVRAHPIDGPWYDIGNSEGLEAARAALADDEPPVESLP